jgi:phage terminase large subunit-like protein
MGYGVDGWCWLLEWGVPFLTGQKGDGKSRTNRHWITAFASPGCTRCG